MPIEWNFLNPYMSPLSESFQRGATHGLQFKRHRENLGERQRQFDAREPYREALVQRLMQQNAQGIAARNAYNWANVGTGVMFGEPETKEGVSGKALNPYGNISREQIISGYLNLPQAQKIQYDLIDTTVGGQPGQRYVKQGTEGFFPSHQNADNWGPIQYDKRLGFAYQVNKSTGAVKHLSGAGKDGKGSGKGGGKGDYTIQQMVDDNLAHYKNEFRQRTANMTDPVTGIPYPEFRGQYQQVQQEIFQRFQEDNYRINQSQRPSWLTGAGDPEQIQAIYNQLRNLGFNPAQIAEQLRQQGIQIE
jgi:hypothetical protein